MQQFLIILRGAPASGKSTISKRLRNFDEKIAWLKVDNFKDFFADDSSSALAFVNGSAVATLGYLLDQGFSVVMDGVFQDTAAIDLATESAHAKGVKTIVYQITCELETLLARDKTREGVAVGCRKPLGDHTITRIYQAIENNSYPGSKLLDTETQTVEQCVETILRDLK